MRSVDEGEVQRWFTAYLEEFVAVGRRDVDDAARLVAHYAVPLVLSSPRVTTTLTDEAAIVAAISQQIEGMRAAGFAATEVLGGATTVLNASCALHQAALRRTARDGSEIARFDVTYLITDQAAVRRISALIVHSHE